MGRLLRFRAELVTLWRAFFAPETPLHLKALMVLIPLYLLSPLDIVPDFIPILGWVDDAIVIPLLVSWIAGMLPRRAPAYTRQDGSPIIDGDYRRL